MDQDFDTADFRKKIVGEVIVFKANFTAFCILKPIRSPIFSILIIFEFLFNRCSPRPPLFFAHSVPPRLPSQTLGLFAKPASLDVAFSWSLTSRRRRNQGQKLHLQVDLGKFALCTRRVWRNHKVGLLNWGWRSIDRLRRSLPSPEVFDLRSGLLRVLRPWWSQQKLHYWYRS